MQNIDPLYLATPLTVLAMAVGLLALWRHRGKLPGSAMLYSLVAYAAAIALKYAVQVPTIGTYEAATGGGRVALGVYYGAQTALFEVGLAYLVARFAVSHTKLGPQDGEGYGLGLAFWENGALFAVPLLVNYVAYYLILSGTGGTAQSLYSILYGASPALFFPPVSALPLIGYAVLERVSSTMVHFSWGLLCLSAAAQRKAVLLFAALPIGFMVDFLVPFANLYGVGLFELALFLFSLAALALSLVLTQPCRRPGNAVVAVAPSNT